MNYDFPFIVYWEEEGLLVLSCSNKKGLNRKYYNYKGGQNRFSNYMTVSNYKGTKEDQVLFAPIKPKLVKGGSAC